MEELKELVELMKELDGKSDAQLDSDAEGYSVAIAAAVMADPAGKELLLGAAAFLESKRAMGFLASICKKAVAKLGEG